MKPSLARLTLRGFKTIRELKDFELGRLTLLIGPNGAGKTNFLSFFRMLSRMLTPPGELQLYTAEQGGATALMHVGAFKAAEVEATMTLPSDLGTDEYGFRLFRAADDSFRFSSEWYRYTKAGVERPLVEFEKGRPEAQLIGESEGGNGTTRRILRTLRGIRVHHFHDTSAGAHIRNKWPVEDALWLKEDGANLAPFLYRQQESEPKYYRRIVETLRLILPFFADFELAPEHGHLLLRWRERGSSDRVFGASQAADGMLRLMALVALLQQQETNLPDVLILDEPELGLHPYAIEVLAALLQSASVHTQVIVATQSVSVIDRFEPHDIVVVDRSGSESTFRRLNDAALAEWRERYTMSELWEKNVLGGRPQR
jgi:predicted ATPase